MLNCCANSERQDERNLERSKAIDRLLRVDERKKASEVKLLLLGAASSGKSTLLKQLRLVYADGFSIKERHVWRGKIFNSLYTSLRRILGIMESRGVSLVNQENAEYAEMMFIDTVIGPEDPFPIQYQEPFKRLWVDEGVQQIFARSDDFAFPDNWPYFLDDSTRLFATDYIPTDQDILRCRIITRGIVETIFELGRHTYRVFDVGGQRSQRRQWIHCFEDVNCVVFVVALSGYCQNLEEDAKSNQMREALVLFESIANSIWFKNSSIILFFNKMDIFLQKIKTRPVDKFFPKYTGDPFDAEMIQEFFATTFISKHRDPDKKIFTHFINSTDADIIKRTMDSVQENIVLRNLGQLLAV